MAEGNRTSSWPECTLRENVQRLMGGKEDTSQFKTKKSSSRARSQPPTPFPMPDSTDYPLTGKSNLPSNSTGSDLPNI